MGQDEARMSPARGIEKWNQFAEVRGHGGPRGPDEGTAFPRGEGRGPGSSLGGGEAGKVGLNRSSCVAFCRDQTRKIYIVRDPATLVC